MSLESDMEILGEVSLFGDLSRDQLRLLAFSAEHRLLRQGETLFRAEARADAGFVIVSGAVSLFQGEGRNLHAVATFGRGALLGEMALLTETRRAATAVTDTDCDVIRITRPIFLRMLREYPEIAAALHAQMRTDLLDLTARLAALDGRFQD